MITMIKEILIQPLFIEAHCNVLHGNQGDEVSFSWFVCECVSVCVLELELDLDVHLSLVWFQQGAHLLCQEPGHLQKTTEEKKEKT